MSKTIFKICTRPEWDSAVSAGEFIGSAADVADGFIHFSAGHQVAATAAKHFSGQNDLVLVSVDPLQLGEQLKWEPSRGGDLFPHLYGPLPVTAAAKVDALPLNDQGTHVFPPGVAD